MELSDKEPESLDAWRRMDLDLEPLRQQIQEQRQQTGARLHKKASGLDLASWLRRELDGVLLQLRDLMAAQGCPCPPVVVYATGGYGMGWVCPRSDVDLLVVYLPEMVDLSELARWSGALQTAVRDLGLRVGLAHRTPQECLHLAHEDLTIATSMLQARLLWGDEHLARQGWDFASLDQQVAQALRAKDGGQGFARAVLQGRQASHKRSGQTVYLLEPDIKSGRGGMRDLHALLWSARVLHGARGMREAALSAGADPDEVITFCQAADTLYLVRTALHHIGARFGNNRLTFDHQEKIAALLGYQEPTAQGGELLPVERFMQSFYRAADSLATLSMRWQRLWLLPEADSRPVLVIPGICVRQGHIDLVRQADTPEAHELVPRAEEGALDPERAEEIAPPGLDALSSEAEALLRRNPIGVYEVALDLGLPLHPVVESHLARVTRAHHIPGTRPEAMASLRRLLCSQDTPNALIDSMARCGLLLWLLHEFEPTHALAQHDVYHVYTVDAHLRIALAHGRAALSGQLEGYGPVWDALRELASQIPSHRREVLLLACLLHDVGKGQGGDHSVIGAQLAGQIGPRLQLTQVQTRHLQLLIREHLLLPRISQRRDINDDDAIRKVALSVRSLAALEDLTLLSALDMMAVAPGNLTEWKAQLLVSLYHRVRRVLEEGLDMLWRRDEELQRRKEQIILTLEDEQMEAPARQEMRAFVQDFFSNLPESYLLRTSPRSLARHVQLFASREQVALELAAGSLAESTEVVAVTRDRPATLATISGVLAAHDLSILHAQIWLLDTEQVLATFLVQTSSGKALHNQRRAEKLQETIRAALEGQVRPEELLARRRSSGLERPAPEVSTVVKTDQESNRHHTVLEVQTRDRLGLLWRITSILDEAHCRVHFAKISTEGVRAIDTFYIDRAREPHGPLKDGEAEALKRRLERALEEEEDHAAR